MNSSGSQSAPPKKVPEVQAYLKRLILSIVVGILLMGATATWAWNTIGKDLQNAPPLPSGTPPISSIPATTR